MRRIQRFLVHIHDEQPTDQSIYIKVVSLQRESNKICVVPGRYQYISLRDLLSIVLDHLYVNICPDLMHSQMALNALEDWFGLEVYNVERME